jgi:hypothetical protein
VKCCHALTQLPATDEETMLALVEAYSRVQPCGYTYALEALMDGSPPVLTGTPGPTANMTKVQRRFGAEELRSKLPVTLTSENPTL